MHGRRFVNSTSQYIIHELMIYSTDDDDTDGDDDDYVDDTLRVR